jgi:hypothetical protein
MSGGKWKKEASIRFHFINEQKPTGVTVPRKRWQRNPPG